MKPNDIAILFAAQKEIERLIKGQNVPTDTRFSVGDQSVTITLPSGLSLERSSGDGDGTVEKRATQNLNGYAILHALMRHLMKFKQHNVAKAELMEIVQDAIDNGNTSEATFEEQFPDEAKELNKMRDDWRQSMPKRKETTPKRFTRPNKNAQATYQIHGQQKAA